MTRKTKSNAAKKTKVSKQQPTSRDVSPSKRTISLPLLVLLIAVVIGIHRMVRGNGGLWSNSNRSTYLSRKQVVERKRYDVPCHMKKKAKDHVEGCHLVGTGCGRVIRDHFVTPDVVRQLREIAEVGMANRSRLGGPTIMDINTGFVKDSDGLINIYQSNKSAPPAARFTADQFVLYRRVIEEIRQAVMAEFGLQALYFTAPTFITRAIGNSSWQPAEIHDEYWHLHIDKDNTHHYDYSGLLYLADYEEDFTGGLLAFVDKDREQVVEPARGRLMMFTSGKENLHQVRKVETGTRYVMSMWFTCDQRRQFKNFLDGRMHQHFVRADD